jgi:hypothetical protein
VNAAPTPSAPTISTSGSALVLALAGATVLLHLLTNTRYNFFRDEFYYMACGEHLAWGYVDHPPLVALLAKLSRTLFGDSLAGLRLLPALAAGAVVWLAGLMACDLGGGRATQGLAALAVIVAPAYLAGFTLFTMNAFDVLFWTLILWIAIRILAGGSPKAWLLLGLVAGVGLLNKHSVLFVLAGLFAGLLLTPARRHLRTRWPWLGGAIALAIFAPHLVWQAQHAWPTLEFMSNARRLKNAPITPLAFLVSQVLIMLPLTAPVWIAGLGWMLGARGGRSFRAIGWAYLAILAVFIVTQAKPYYLAAFYPALFAAGAVAVEPLLRARHGGWLRVAIPALWIAGGALIAPLVLPVLPPDRLERYLRALHLQEPMSERHRPPRLTQTYADQFGWEEMVAKIARAYQRLTPEERARCGIFASNYGEAGAIDFYGRKYGLPRALSGHNNYFLWGPGTRPVDIVITIGETREDVEKTFRHVVEVDRTRNEWCMPYEDDLPILLGRDPKARLQDIWPRCKQYI